MHSAPTQRQLEVLRSVSNLAEKHGIPPTLRELAVALGLRQAAGVREHLLALQSRGLVTWEPDKVRTLRITEAGRTLLEVRHA